MAALQIRQDHAPSDLRRRAGREKDRRAAMRLLAIANALQGMTRAEAARLAGMERQALRDAVLRFNAEGPDGLHDRPRPGRPERLHEGSRPRSRRTSCAVPGQSGMGSALGVWWTCASMSSTAMACATASGVCPACSSA